MFQITISVYKHWVYRTVSHGEPVSSGSLRCQSLCSPSLKPLSRAALFSKPMLFHVHVRRHFGSGAQGPCGPPGLPDIMPGPGISWKFVSTKRQGCMCRLTSQFVLTAGLVPPLSGRSKTIETYFHQTHRFQVVKEATEGPMGCQIIYY